MLNKSFCLEASLNIIIIINNKHRVLWRLKNRVIAKVLGRTLSWAGPPGTSIPLPSQEMVLACDVALPGGSQPGAALPLDRSSVVILPNWTPFIFQVQLNRTSLGTPSLLWDAVCYRAPTCLVQLSVSLSRWGGSRVWSGVEESNVPSIPVKYVNEHMVTCHGDVKRSYQKLHLGRVSKYSDLVLPVCLYLSILRNCRSQ